MNACEKQVQRNHLRSLRHAAAGFSMIEVLVALLVLAFGLLGFALLQTMNLRFAESANQRTQATNLAYDLLDQMRGNRIVAVQYSGLINANATVAPCSRDVGTVAIATRLDQWRCEMTAALGTGSSAVVAYDPDNRQASVDITWGDERWNDANKDGTVTAGESNKHFLVETRL